MKMGSQQQTQPINPPKRGMFFLSFTLLFIGIVCVGIGSYEYLHPYSISLFDDVDNLPNPNPIIPPNNVDDPEPIYFIDGDDDTDIVTYPNGVMVVEDYFLDDVQYYLIIWVDLGDFVGYLVINNDTTAVHFDGQWWGVEHLDMIVDGTIGFGVDISRYIDGYIDDEANAHDDADESDDGGYDPDSRNTLGWFFFGSSAVVFSILPLMIKKNPN